MYSFRIRDAIFGTLSLAWLNTLLPYVKQIIGSDPIIFPQTPVSHFEAFKLISLSILLALTTLISGIKELRRVEKKSVKPKRKLLPILFCLLITVPIAYAYIYEQDLNSLTQTIINLALMDVDFDDLLPGEDPPGWQEDSGNWTAVDDGGNIVYYQDDNSDSEALSITTTGDTSWVNYTFEVDLKFVEGNTKKDGRGAVLCFRHQGENNYYWLALREFQDTLELYKHGTGGGGNLVASTSFTLVTDTWYHVNITIRGDIVDVSIDNTLYFTSTAMNGSYDYGSVGIGTIYYKVMFDDIYVEPQ